MASPHPDSGNVPLLYSSDRALGPEAGDLVRFDVESVSRVAAGSRDGEPDVWLARPEGYEGDGHVLRDSESIRLVAWCRSASVLYATDGCNTCRHPLAPPLESLSPDAVRALASRIQIPEDLLQRLRNTPTRSQ